MALNKLEKEYIELGNRTAEALEGLQEAIRDMNDTNILHAKTLQANTQVIENNTKAVTDIEKFWGKIVFILTIAIAMLAGVEKIGQLLGI